MALKKAIEYKGFNPEYHMVTSVNYNKMEESVTVELSSYRDQAYRDGNLHQRIRSHQYGFKAEDFFMTTDVVECAYLLVKQKEEWAEAEDV